MPEQLWFTALLNRYFGGIAAALLHMVGLQPKYAKAPISNPVAMEILVVLILLVFFIIVRARLSVEKPEACSTWWKPQRNSLPSRRMA